MGKFELFDIETIKDCIRRACVTQIADELSKHGCTDTYKVQQSCTQEAERLIDLMDSLKGEKL